MISAHLFPSHFSRFSSCVREDFDIGIHEKAFKDLQNKFKDQEKLVEQFKLVCLSPSILCSFLLQEQRMFSRMVDETRPWAVI